MYDSEPGEISQTTDASLLGSDPPMETLGLGDLHTGVRRSLGFDLSLIHI